MILNFKYSGTGATEVLQILLPLINDIQKDLTRVKNDLAQLNRTGNDIKDDLSHVKNDLTNLNKTVSNLSVTVSHLSGDLEEYKNQTTSELAGLQNMFNVSELAGLQNMFNVSFTSHTEQLSHLNGKMDTLNASMREDLRAMESCLEEHKNQTTSELAGLQNMFNVSLTSHTEQLSHLNGKMDLFDASIMEDLSLKLDSVNASMNEELRAMESCLEEHKNQTTSELAGLQNMFNVSFTSHTEQLSHLNGKMDTLNASMREDLRAMESCLEEHKNQTTSKLAGLQNMFNVSLTSHTEQLSHLNGKMELFDASIMEDLSLKLDSVNASMNEELRAMESCLEEHKNQTTSELAGLQNMFNVSFTSHTEQLSHLNGKMDTLNASMREDLRAMESCLEEHKNQTTSELAGLQNMFNVSLTSHTEQLSHLNGKMDLFDASIMEDLSCIKEDLSSLNETMNRINSHMEEHDNHVTTEPTMINECLQPNVTQPPNNDSLYTCGGTGGWRRVVYLDMTDPNTNCPSGWKPTSHSRRTCGRVSTGRLTCDSVTFSVSGGDYTRVCGRIKAYQSGGPDAFETYDDGEATTIDSAYVSGVSLTHGRRRQHIWTFAAGYSENHRNRNDACPCDANIDITIPPFVGGDYFCESGRHQGEPYGNFFPNDPLWDGKGCSTSSTCCSFNNPPYFTKKLPHSTSDDIEARICLSEDINRDDIPIELIELYVQ